MNYGMNKKLKKKMIEGYIKNAKRDIELVKEWENASNEVSWKY